MYQFLQRTQETPLTCSERPWKAKPSLQLSFPPTSLTAETKGTGRKKANPEWKEKQDQEGKESGWWEGKLQAEYRELTEMGAGHIPHPVLLNSCMALLRQESFSLPEFGSHLSALPVILFWPSFLYWKVLFLPKPNSRGFLCKEGCCCFSSPVVHAQQGDN